MEAVKNVIIYGRDTLMSGIKYVYSDINPSTLTGAIDVIVVEQKDGTFKSGPFHVRFGKMGTLKPADKIVDIHLNGKYLEHLHMKLGSAGEAYFIESVVEKQDIDFTLEVSPFQSDAEDEIRYTTNERAQSSENVSRCKQKRIRRPNRIKSECNIDIPPDNEMNCETICLSDNDDNHTNIMIREGYNSDGVVENPKKDVIKDMNMQWEWGNFPRRKFTDVNPEQPTLEPITSTEDNASKSNVEIEQILGAKESKEVDLIKKEHHLDLTGSEHKPRIACDVYKKPGASSQEPSGGGGVYLEELMGFNVPEEMKKKFLYTSDSAGPSNVRQAPSSSTGHNYQEYLQTDHGYKSDDASSSPHSTKINPVHSTYPNISQLKLSLCGELVSSSKINEEKFNHHLISYEDFMKEPDEILKNANLVILLNGKYYNWSVAGPMILSIIAFQAELPQTKVNSLKNCYMARKPRRTTWFRWGRQINGEPDDDALDTTLSGGTGPTEVHSLSQTAAVSPDQPKSESIASQSLGGTSLQHHHHPAITRQLTPAESEVEANNKVYLKKIRLSSEEIAALNLKHGRNDIKFSMTTKYQGTTCCYAAIYRWKWCDKIVISDVDGTITKSDVLGHVLPILGRDWTQAGVAKLYNKIAANNYKFIYLTARAIGQSTITRNFLQDITQDASEKLPEGPILLSPTSLFQSLHREVIAKKPEIFKIECLQDVARLFPVNYQPLYAGFGNRTNDVTAYKAVGIDLRRIFTVNTEGSLKNEYCEKWSTSYGNLWEIAEHFFQYRIDPSDALSFRARQMMRPAAQLSYEMEDDEGTSTSSWRANRRRRRSSSESYSGQGVDEAYTDVNYWSLPLDPSPVVREFQQNGNNNSSLSITPGGGLVALQEARPSTQRNLTHTNIVTHQTNTSPPASSDSLS